jgi:hypothetical protein
VTGGITTPDWWQTQFPTTGGAPQTTPAGNIDAFLLKLNNAGSQLLYSTLFGGNIDEFGWGVTVDVGGNAVMVGTTYSSSGLPTAQPLPASPRSGISDIFLTRINTSGTAWDFVTYLGGNGADEGSAVAISRGGRIVITGMSDSSDLPDAGDLSTSYALGADVLLASFDLGTGRLVWSSTFGGQAYDKGRAIAARARGDIVIAGHTDGWYFPSLGGLSSSYGGGMDAFVATIARGPLPPTQEMVQGCDCDAQYDTAFPVNTRTGNFWSKATDLAVQTPGPALVWARTYASQAITATTGTFGVGWQSLYATSIITPGGVGGEAGQLIVRSPEHNRLRFRDLGSGRYLAGRLQHAGLRQRRLHPDAAHPGAVCLRRHQWAADGDRRCRGATCRADLQRLRTAHPG